MDKKNNKINSINSLKKLEGFLQLNYSKGFKYVDKAGEFFNEFYSGGNFPPHVMYPTGMTVKINEKTQLKASPHNLWMHFVEPEAFDYQSLEFMNKAILVNSIFEPETYTRIGWRNYLVYECKKSDPSIIPSNLLDGGEFNEIVFTKDIGKFKSRISISRLVQESTSAKAILFDIDLFQKENIDRSDFEKISSFLRDMEAAYQSETLLNLVNKLLS